MRTLSLLLACMIALPLQPATASRIRQDRMADCDRGAAQKGLAGESRKLYLRACLHGRDEKTAAQRAKSRACAADAATKHLHGDARRAFVRQCIEG